MSTAATTASFSYSVSDGTTTVNAGTTINVTPINDAPVASSSTITVAEESVNTPLGLAAPTDVDAQIERLFADLAVHWPSFDGFVHSIGFAPREAIAGNFLDGLSREGFRIAHDISAYSFPAMAKAALPYLNDKSSLITLSYLGALRSIPNYNTMGLAKASLEASVRYLAEAVGRTEDGRSIRANGISAGPIKTLAASGIKDFGKLLSRVADAAPLRRNVTIEDVGNVAAFLLSDLASGMTAEITYVDGGFSQTAGLSADQV